MENRLITEGRLLSLSGKNLFWLLTIGVIFGDLCLDFFHRDSKFFLSLSFPLIISAVLTMVLGTKVVPFLAKIKAGQVIREDGPKSHLSKAGTPTMGGIFFIPVAVFTALILSKFNADVVAVCLVTLGYSLIGGLDDWQILSRKSNKGITPKMKLILQIVLAVIFCLWMMWGRETSVLTSINLPWGLILPLGFLFAPFAAFVMVAESNATNITDGVDGLMGGLGAIAFLGMAAITASTSPELATFCVCISGGCLGFLAFNRNPARVFMGNTGSLALGGALASIALLTNNIWELFIISGILFVETLSVMLQVGYYKATKGPDGIGKRLFKMAPFHHHLELSGWKETQVVGVFYLINLLLVVICLVSRF